EQKPIDLTGRRGQEAGDRALRGGHALAPRRCRRRRRWRGWRHGLRHCAKGGRREQESSKLRDGHFGLVWPINAATRRNRHATMRIASLQRVTVPDRICTRQFGGQSPSETRTLELLEAVAFQLGVKK